MCDISDSLMHAVILVVVSVVAGTLLLIAVAFIRRWQQIRYGRYVHALQRAYRPVLAKVLAGTRSPADVETLRELRLADLEILLEPVFSRRRLPERCLVFFQALCLDLGLIELWESRLIDRQRGSGCSRERRRPHEGFGRFGLRHFLRARGIRNLGAIRHRPSWPLLIKALDDRRKEIQLAALRALGAMAAPESLPMLRERMHAVAQGRSSSPPLRPLQAAIANFSIACAPALLPSLRHTNRAIRLLGIEALSTIISREAARHPHLLLSLEHLTPPMVDMLLDDLAFDVSADIRARAADAIAHLAHPRAVETLKTFLGDPQGIVRLHAIKALAHMRWETLRVDLDIRACLSDSDWRVREATIQALLSLGPETTHQLYEHFLASGDETTRDQIVEVIERQGLMGNLVKQYTQGANGVQAQVVEQLATRGAPLGVAGTLRVLGSEVQRKFLGRFLPLAAGKWRLSPKKHPEVDGPLPPEQMREFPPRLAA